MRRIFNPFIYVAGGKALAIGVAAIVASSLMLYSGGMIQDSFLHFGLAEVSLLQTLAVQIIYWLVPAVALYLCGVTMTKSKIRIIDMLGTTAFAQIILLLMIAPMVLPVVQNATIELLGSLQSGANPERSNMIIMVVTGFWSTLCLILYYIWNYNAFTVSCNVKGAKAITMFVIVQLAVTFVSNLI